MAYGSPPRTAPVAGWIGVGVAAVAVLVLLLALGRGEGSPETDDAGEDGTSAEVVVGDASNYPDAPEDGAWDVEPLDDASYVQVTTEATCMAQSYHGPPETLTREMNRIYFHHETNAHHIAAFAADLNLDDERAISVGQRIADAIERCP